MTFVVAVSPEDHGEGALPLAIMLARSAGQDLLVCTVVPASWQPGMARIDAEYQDYLIRLAGDTLSQARARMPDDIAAEYLVHHARSAPAGLIEIAQRCGASLLVLGSSTAGLLGHIALGSVSDRLLHSSPIPMALSPRGLRSADEVRVHRVTVAYGGAAKTDDLVAAAARVATDLEADLRLASFAVRPRTAYSAGVGFQSEDQVVDEWAQDSVMTAHRMIERARKRGGMSVDHVSIEIGRGESWAVALDDVGWEAGDVLVVGSSSSGTTSRVFLGSRATKIVRHSPVPVVVVPWSAAAELAEKASAGS